MRITGWWKRAAIVFVTLHGAAMFPAAAQVVGVSAIIDVSNGNITTYSATEVDYNTSLYYEPYIEGYLYQDGNLIGAGSATANTTSNCDGTISSQVAEGCIQKPLNYGSTYEIESDHYLIMAFAYYDGTNYYYSNPEGFLPGSGGAGTDLSNFGSGGGDPYFTYEYLYLGSTAVIGTVEAPANNTPTLTGIQPDVWPSGMTTPGVVFTGQYFGTNPPALNISDGSISYYVTSSNDTQIVADVTVQPGTPDEDVDVSVTSNGDNGQPFQSAGGGQPTGGPVKATVRLPPASPEITIIAWVDGSAISLPGGANSNLVNALNGGPSSCFIQVAQWTAGIAKNISSQTDRDYANAWLLMNSANPPPPSTIDAQQQLLAGNFRLFNLWGGASKPTAQVGITPDPCRLGFVPKWLEAGQASQYMGIHGPSAGGNIVQQLAEGRIGRVGQRGSMTINQQRTVPWIWSAIELDSQGNFVSPQHEIFPTYTVYMNGQVVSTLPQSALGDFIAKDQSNQIVSTSQIQ